ncbi:MAG: hypothetical protein LW721_16795 [Flammeovirgaceae bacterium]|jgi:hypothetical protein|nr:hypothetical protein [Flammeovirgaceae bacterium]
MNVKKYAIVFSLMFFAEKSFGQNTFPPSGNVGIGTTSPRGQFDVAGTGDIFLAGNPNLGSAQSIYLPGHIFLSPYAGTNWTYLQARRFDNSGSTNLQFRTWNAGSLTDAMVITSIGRIGIGTTTPIRQLHVSGNANTIARIEATDDGYASLEFAGNNRTWQLSKRPSLHYSDALQLYYHDGSTWSPHITFLPGGNVGIGTTDPGSFKLAVNGKTWSTEVQVAVTRPPDYVFEPTYDLKPLAEIETYIKENKHLPEVPSAKEMEKNGVQLGEMNMLLLKKVEELTLYVIEQQKENTKQADEIKELKKLIKK